MKYYGDFFLLKNLTKGNCSCDTVQSCRSPCCRIFGDAEMPSEDECALL